MTMLREQIRASFGGFSGKVLFIILVLIFWSTISAVGFLDSFLFPGPVFVLYRLDRLVFGGEILPDIASTLLKIGIAFTVGSLSGIAVGIFLSKWDWMYNSASPFLDFLRSIPATALFPLFLLIFGAGDPTNTALAMWICALYLSLHVSKGLRGTSETSLIVAKSLKKSEIETLVHVRFKEALPIIFVGFRTAVSLTIAVVVVAEMFVGTKNGIGKVLIDAAYVYDIPKLYAGILVIGVIGYLLNFIVAATEQRVVHWHGK